MRVMVPPEGRGVVGVKERVTSTEALPAMRWDEAMTNDTDLTCPKIAENSIPPCVCNGDPHASNVDTLALAVTVETYEFVKPAMEHTTGINGAVGAAALDRFSSSTPDGSVILADTTRLDEFMLEQMGAAALALKAEKRRPVSEIVLKGTLASEAATMKVTLTVTLVAATMQLDRVTLPPLPAAEKMAGNSYRNACSGCCKLSNVTKLKHFDDAVAEPIFEKPDTVKSTLDAAAFVALVKLTTSEPKVDVKTDDAAVFPELR